MREPSPISVEYVDHMGDDRSVVNAARVSFAKRAEGYSDAENAGLTAFLGTGRTRKETDRLARRVMEGLPSRADALALIWAIQNTDTHWSPFGHTAITVRITAPVAVRAQLYRHTVGLLPNEESRRYITEIPDWFLPAFRQAPAERKQGSGGAHPRNATWATRYEAWMAHALDLYEAMIGDGVAPEQARFVLPQGVMVRWVWTGNVASFARVARQRLHPTAQAETAEVAHGLDRIIRPLFPTAWGALIDPPD